MADLIIALVLMAGGGGAAEWVRSTCRKQLHHPIVRAGNTVLPD